MSRTLAEIAVALFVIVIFFRLGVELAPLIADWWNGLRNDIDERNDDDHQS